MPCPLGPKEPAEHPDLSPALQSTLQATCVLGGIGRRLRREQERQTGGALSDQRAGEERRAFTLPTQAQEACWAPR